MTTQAEAKAIVAEIEAQSRSGSLMMFEELGGITNQQWREMLRTLDDTAFTQVETRATALILDGIQAAERRAPGYMADRLIALGDRSTHLFADIPAHMIGGKDLLDLAADHGNSSLYTIQEVIWPKFRERFRWYLGNYFSRVAAGERGVLPKVRREVRVVHLAAILRFLFGPRGPSIGRP